MTTIACAVCFQMQQSPATDGLQAAVIVMVSVTTVVLGGFGVFLAKFLRRS
jgi:hypothetical protein